MKNQRKVEVKKDGVWSPIVFADLHNGDIFRMFESTGEPVVGSNQDTEWVATSEPYLVDSTYAIDVKE